MPDGYPIQTNFTAGEVSTLLLGRVDVQKYFNGVQKLENFIVKPQGGITRRSGTRYLATTKDSTKKSILLDFRFSNSDAFILEFGNLYIRFFKNGAVIGVPYEVVTTYTETELRGLYFAQSADVLFISHPNHQTQILSRLSDTSWTLAALTIKDGPYLDIDDRDYSMTLSGITNRATLTSTANDFVVGDVNKYVEYNYKTQKVIAKVIAYVSATQITIEPYENIVDVSKLDRRTVLSFAASGGGWNARIQSTLDVWTPDAEGCFIRVGTSWYLTTTHLAKHEKISPSPGSDYLVDVIECGTALTMVATSPSTGTLSFTSHVISATLTSSENVFVAGDVGRQFRLDFLAQQVWGTITAYTSAKAVTVSLGRMMPSSNKTGETYLNNATTLTWRLGAWYAGNWPAVVCFHEERLTFAASLFQPQTLWFSKSGDFDNMAPSEPDSKVLDSSAITITLASGQVDSIQWMISSGVLLIGTLGGEWQTKASTINEPLTPTNIAVTRQTSYGSAKNIKPWKIGTSVFFVQGNGNIVRELVYDYQFDSYVGRDLTIASEHIAREWSGIVQTAYQKSPNSIFWAATSVGALLGLTFEKDQEVVAWHRHIIGGFLSNGFVSTGDAEFNEKPVVESVAVVPSADGFSETVYLIVKRYIPGLVDFYRYVEYIEKEYDPVKVKNDLRIASGDPFYDVPLQAIKAEAYYVDCGLTYRGAAVNTVTGLGHLVGEYVEVVANGSYRGRYLVSVASVTFTGPSATIVHVGLFNRAWLKNLPIESGSASGTAQGKIKRVHKVILRLLNTIGLSVGRSSDELKLKSFRPITARMSESPDLFTGDKPIDINQDYGFDSVFVVQQDQPYPVTILAMMPQMQTNQ